MRKLLAAVVGLALLSLSAAGCGMPQKAANAMITMTQSALDETKDKAMMVAPDEVAAIQATMDSAKASMAAGDYKAAILTMQPVPDRVKAMKDSLPAKEQQLRTQWEQMQPLAGGLDEFRKHVDQLAAMRRLPAGMEKSTLEAAKASLANMTETWVAAQNSFKTGEFAKAVAEAGAVKQMLLEGMAMLGMQPPDSLAA